MKKQKEIWSIIGNQHYLSYPAIEKDKLDNAVYKLRFNENRGEFLLVKESDSFNFDYKVYGLQSDFISRVNKTYCNTIGNLGVLLNGLKGTGKTVSAKMICNELKQPIILIEGKRDGITGFINSIPQDITIFIDEYEKIFGSSSEMLTIMDGALNSNFRRVFLLTTNELNVDGNLIQRPSRIRYLKKFEDLSPLIVEEIIDDVLVNKELKDDCVKFISNLEVITVDIVKSILAEVNIHNESPISFSDVFNVKVLRGKYDVAVRNEDGSFTNFITDEYISEKPNYNERDLNDWIRIGDKYYGKISKIISYNTIEVSPVHGSDTKHVLTEPTIFKVTDGEVKNYNYAYGYEKFTEKSNMNNSSSESLVLKKLIKNMNDNSEIDFNDKLQDSNPSISAG